MTIKQRVRLLERWHSALPLYEEPPRYTREELSKMSVHALHRLYFDMIRTEHTAPPVDQAELRRHRAELDRLSPEELMRRYREAFGEAPY